MKHPAMALGMLFAMGAATPAAAEDLSPSQNDNGWQVSFTPYVWAAGVGGEIDLPGDPTIDFDKSFIDTLSSLKFAFMGALNVENDKLVFFVDGNYLSLKSGSNDIDEPDHLAGEVKTKLFEATVLAGYKVMNSGGTSLELMGGARIISLKNDIFLQLPLREIETERNRSAVAPVLASRLKTPLGGRWSLSLYGDIGGLTDLDLTWQLLGSVNYRLSNRWTLGAGYRYLSIHSDKNGGKFNAHFSGPLIGATYRF